MFSPNVVVWIFFHTTLVMLFGNETEQIKTFKGLYVVASFCLNGLMKMCLYHTDNPHLRPQNIDFH